MILRTALSVFLVAVMLIAMLPAAVSAQAVVILVPPAGLQPFTDLTPTIPQSDASSYSIRYEGASGQVGQWGGWASLSGFSGSAKFDERLLNAAVLGYTNCPPDASYCAASGYIGDGPPTAEIFRGLRVGNAPAVAEHITCCNGHYWFLTWYSAPANTTYVMEFALGVADRYSAQAIGSGNVGAAQAIAQIAAQLVALR